MARNSPAEIAQRVAAHHSNLNTYAAVVCLLEGGLLYGGRQQLAASKIIKIANKAQQEELTAYDAEIVKLNIKEQR